MYKVIYLEDGVEKEIDRTFNEEIEAEFYMEAFEYEAYRIEPIKEEN